MRFQASRANTASHASYGSKRTTTVGAAYKREQLIKRWRREWKLALIEKFNPRWEDLFPSIAGFGPPLGEVVNSKLDPFSGRDPGESLALRLGPFDQS